MSNSQAPADQEAWGQDDEYVVQLRNEEKTLGAAFFVTARFLLTAAHVLHPLPRDQTTVEIVHSGVRLQGRIAQRTSRFDVALIELVDDRPGRVRPPPAGRCRPREDWCSPYRPDVGEPALTGSVEAVDIAYQCEEGEVMRALQLVSRLDLGDFSGYSGAPVERVVTDARPTLAGLLLEQVWRRETGPRQARTASNVLFAGTLAQALSCFDHFDVGHLLSVLTKPNQDDAPTDAANVVTSSRATKAVQEADILLRALDDWAARGIYDDGELSLLRLRVANNVIDSAMR
ncbi:hypothetical protein O7635_36210 [Asanoa sp. WMMD1127]|uniref:hypothetical protein n=1 Tax=Asanoa sp. WMMD1127 TaxID=3016107 RepID=UPI002417121B|nr:hypothetical protein [Asanoa sp. WMMD1127]MDG4827321.1 hypothetical protein [Asanoa sp. WMMD1127]